MTDPESGETDRRTVRWYVLCGTVAACAYGLSMALIALTGTLTTSDALLSIIPVAVIFGVLAWWDRPQRRREQR